ncbi:phosphate/phosphite/phosphonate ABC transporter substrate-binding protein [Vibrio sp. SCSIO 43136]|uniref:phosphate/phosphite/phosphonate ABC transporter substrate-binding protein n=1 Tax=Vibrio sp. SCSIO 43136 TaxID=2819101 RepID=UPI002074DCD8|nr:phosphate/phosphite/phosphonate ABC transporter substrate-binding protein [Vibrio sp. SCSIO 43136]USD67968.1 phosphate/phosphite/phosphonate ABC transporter substrate-binding protein [Vibrio sp. SCSIO 43136]
MKRALYLFTLWVVASLISPSYVYASVTPSLEPDTFVIGVISSNPKKAIKRAGPLAKYIAERLRPFGVQHGKVIVAPDNKRMSRWLAQGRVDMVSETVFSANELIKESGGAIPIAKRWKGGLAEYYTVFFSKQSMDIRGFEDLVNKTVVFEDRGSTSAFYIPAAILLDSGFELFELTSPRESPPEGKIGYLFADELTKAGGEINMYSWVYNGIVSAAAFSSEDWDSDIAPNIKETLHIFYQSRSLARSLELIRPGMAPAMIEAIEQALLDMHESEEGKIVLKRYKKTTKFEAVDEQLMKDLEWAKNLKSLVDDNLVN